jgi:hypothetical protein
MGISSAIPPKVSDLYTANRHGWKLWLTHHSIYPRSIALCAVLAITGCGVPRQVTVMPGNRLATNTEPNPQAAPSFTMTAQPASPVQAPSPCPGCIGVGYNSDATMQVELASAGFIGTVNLSVSGLPTGVVLASPIAPVALNVGDAPAVQVIPVNLYVLPGAAPGSYPFTIVGSPAPGSNSTAVVTIPLVLTVTSGASTAWSAQ